MFVQQLVDALAQGRVEYCVVGGLAVNLHGIPRMTYDVDIMVATSLENLAACSDVLIQLGLEIRLPIRLTDASDRIVAATWENDRNLLAVTFTDPRNPLREVDVLVAPSLDPDGVVARAWTVGNGVKVASVEDLIAMKRRANRAQDRADVAHLLRLKDR